jgi:hypothetical protein
MDFLQELYEKGLGYSCINTARSAPSSIIVLEGDITVGTHPLVQRFIKRVFLIYIIILSYMKKIITAEALYALSLFTNHCQQILYNSSYQAA